MQEKLCILSCLPSLRLEVNYPKNKFMLFISFPVSYSMLFTMGCHFQTAMYMLCYVRSSDRFSNPHIEHNGNNDQNNVCYRQTHTYTCIYHYIVVEKTFCTKSDQFDKPFCGTKTLWQLVSLTSKQLHKLQAMQRNRS